MTSATRSRCAAVAIVGPTAAGKTQVASLLAERLNTQIVSCDAMQVYREFRVLTDRPPAGCGPVHHAAAFVSVGDTMSVARWRNEAQAAVSSLKQAGRVALIVGGTGLYLKALIDGLNAAPAASERERRRLREQARVRGALHLYEELRRVDPVSASRIHPRDLKRIIRALEVFRLSGRPLSAHHETTTGGLKEEMDVLILGLSAPRAVIHRRIEERVDRMLRQGALEEVQALTGTAVSPTAEAVIGFREIRDFWRGEATLEMVRRLIVQRTRRYARRQWIWFRADPRVLWFVQRDEPVETVADRMWRWIEPFLNDRV